MTNDASPENLRKFLESDDPAMVRMGISLAKGSGVEVTAEDLERFLKSEDVETIKTGIMLADEAGIGDEAIEMLCEPLGDENRYVRRHAVKALEKIGDARAVEPLIKALGDRNWDVRRSASTGLGFFHDKRAVEPLIKALEDKSEKVHKAVVEALRKIGKSTVGPLIKTLGDGGWEASRALGEIGDARAVEPLIKALEYKSEIEEPAEPAPDPGESGVDDILSKLSELDDPENAPKKKEKKSDEEEDKLGMEARKAIVEALGKIGDARAVEPLINLGALESGSYVMNALKDISEACAMDLNKRPLANLDIWVCDWCRDWFTSSDWGGGPTGDTYCEGCIEMLDYKLGRGNY